MDVIALGTAAQAQAKAEQDAKRIGTKAEGRFKDVASRLSYLEDVGSKLTVKVIRQVEQSLQSSSGLTIKDGRIELGSSGAGYMTTGTGETTTIFLGDMVAEILSVVIMEQKQNGETVQVEAAYSNEGKSFSNYMSLPLQIIPDAGYWKFRITLTAPQAIASDGVTPEAFSATTPSILGIGLEVREVSIEGRLKELERMSSIQLAKLNFKAGTILSADQLFLHDMQIDLFDSDTGEVIEIEKGLSSENLFDVSGVEVSDGGFIYSLEINTKGVKIKEVEII